MPTSLILMILHDERLQSALANANTPKAAIISFGTVTAWSVIFNNVRLVFIGLHGTYNTHVPLGN